MGNAGGLFHLRDGAVISVESPGSPGVESLLLSSGRIEEGDWTAALVESVETRSLQAALVGRGVIGAAELQGLVVDGLQDGAFAAAAGEIERYAVDEDSDPPLLPAAEGVVPDLLLAATGRRLEAIASFSLSPYRDRVVPGGGAEEASTDERREIVALADGRRTARDLAFALGRSLYPVTVEIGLMLADGLLEIAPPATSFRCSHWGLAALRPRAEVRPDLGISLKSSEV